MPLRLPGCRSALAFAALLCAPPLQTFAQQPAAPVPTSSPFGPHVLVFDPATPHDTMQSSIDRIYAEQAHSEFGPGRWAILFKPGAYTVDVPVGYGTQILGAALTPDAVQIHGDLHADAAIRNNNATTTFWRAAEGLSVTPPGTATTGPQTLQWAVSQGVDFRRMHVHGNMVLHQKRGWASGGWLSDSRIDGTVDSGSQQQWISRNAEWTSWTGANWNMVFAGVNNPPAGDWPDKVYTRLDRVPLVREKPFLALNARAQWGIFVPALRTSSSGVSWSASTPGPGRFIPLSQIYIAQPERDSAATLNAALRAGKHLLLTPGIYPLDAPLHVSRKGTVVLGLGFATLQPTSGTPALIVADVGGVSLAGILFDAGANRSPSLLQVGDTARHTRHAADPIVLSDLFFRIGGAGIPGKVAQAMLINADDTVIDHTWVWRADHGKGVGWTDNQADNGVVVNGNHVIAYGLFVEHFQQWQILWNGEDGRTVMYQSEIPYDPPTQDAWKDTNGSNGWASYKVADTVQRHEAWGLGVYSVFRKPDVRLARAFEAPLHPGIHFHHLITVALGNLGSIDAVIDDTGPATSIHPRVTPKVTDWPAPTP